MDKRIHELSEQTLANAFTEWERRYREDPEGFQSDSDRIAASAETYGEAAALYLLEIVGDLSE